MLSKDDYIAESFARLAARFQPAATAHLGVDLQNGYCKPAYDPRWMPPAVKAHFGYDRTREMLPQLSGLAGAFRASGIVNVWVCQNAEFRESEFADDMVYEYQPVTRKEIRDFVLAAKEICVPVDEDKDRLLMKTGFDLFETVEPARELRAMKVETALLSGGERETCLLATAQGAVRNGFDAYIVDDLSYRFGPLSAAQEAAFVEQCAKDGIGLVTASQLRQLLPKPAGF